MGYPLVDRFIQESSEHTTAYPSTEGPCIDRPATILYTAFIEGEYDDD